MKHTRMLTPVLIALISGMLVAAKTGAASLPFINDEGPSYSVNLTPPNKSLTDLIRSYIDEFRSASPPDESAPLYRLADKELESIRRLLQSRGYYESIIDYQLNARAKEDESKQPAITYNIETGPRITVSQIEFNYPSGIEPPDKQTLSIKEGRALVAQNVIDTLAELRTIAEEKYCLLNVMLDYKTVISREDKSATLTFTLRKSPTVHFNEVSFEGLTSLSPEYLVTQLPFEKGECFSQKKLDLAKLDLLQTNLLARVDPVPKSGELSPPGGSTEETQPLDILFQVKERDHRTVSAGLEYSSDTELGVMLGWEHRNLLGGAEKLNVEVGVNKIEQYISGTYTIPNFILENQDLTFTTDVSKEETDAFESKKIEASAILSRQFNEEISGTLGVAATESRVVEDGNEESFSLISLPASLTYDNRNDILNPIRGWTATASARPFVDISAEDTRFFQWTLSGATYLTAEDWFMHPTLALRAASGTLTGASLDAIPADLRFYVGGGGSVRGYPYQSIGELTDGDPDGGKSYGEVSAELRLKIVGNWGMALFLDGGYAYPTELPSFGQDFLWGAGIGIRYLTGFAPIRFDIAAPLNRRDDIDDPFQLYISIGQAF